MKNLEKNTNPETNNYVVYIHKIQETGIPFYVGKGKIKRPYDFTNRNPYWLKVYEKFNKLISVEIIFDSLTEEEALLKEQEVEKLLIDEGYILTNIAKTGVKGSTGHIKSEEWKLRYGKLMSSLNRGRTLSEEHKIKISEGNKNFGSRPWVGESRIGKKHSKETSLKKSNKLKGRIQSLEEREKRKDKNNKCIIQYDLEKNIIKEWNSIQSAELYFGKGKNQHNISACCRGKQNTAYGFKWAYKIT